MKVDLRSRKMEGLGVGLSGSMITHNALILGSAFSSTDVHAWPGRAQ